MNERLKKLRKSLDLTQQKFADIVGVKQNTVAQYEMGRNEPIDSVISLICREFNVNEEWLRTGNGEMFIQIDKDDELMMWAGRLLLNESDSFKKRFVGVLSTLTESDWDTLKKIAEALHKDS